MKKDYIVPSAKFHNSFVKASFMVLSKETFRSAAHDVTADQLGLDGNYESVVKDGGEFSQDSKRRGFYEGY